MNPDFQNLNYIEKDFCVISQPTFMPWIGWFDLVDQAKTMVLLDDVAFSKQTWQQRNRIRTNKGLEFITVPIKTSGRMGQKINECELSNVSFAKKLFKTIRFNYNKSNHFYLIDQIEKVFLEALYDERLFSLNKAVICWMCNYLGIKTNIIDASQLSINGKRGEHVALICKHLGLLKYLSPSGSEDYLKEDIDSFQKKQIKIYLHEYEHPTYKQIYSPFYPYASIIDLVLNEGENSLKIIRKGRKRPRKLTIK
ncbi:MAG: hypothetical protein CBB97_15030 [Candidatus Endolissoclinum sp. TMED37]|nr:MAG: hypothetical protein CBB97_15030 [Candidatus Endolissoclinum sp. TMED37]|tara:strand:+ start:2109 stop:2867 length:759 start_codon:yes stop_codon:yes gene_type:complete